MIPEMELKLESVLHWETGRLIFLEDLGVPPWEEGCNVLIKSFQIWPTYKEEMTWCYPWLSKLDWRKYKPESHPAWALICLLVASDFCPAELWAFVWACLWHGNLNPPRRIHSRLLHCHSLCQRAPHPIDQPNLLKFIKLTSIFSWSSSLEEQSYKDKYGETARRFPEGIKVRVSLHAGILDC